jgi:glycosyltransferase involved in cell wall biosynthesis
MGIREPARLHETTIIYLCGALDERTRAQRKISSANPAATQKIINFCRAIFAAGVRPLVVSMGRGRQDRSGDAYPAFAKRVSGIPFVYARFVHRPLVTHLVSAFSLACLILRLSRRRKLAILAYNRLWHYIPALIVARMRRVRCFLDLEDGFALVTGSRCARLGDRCVGWLFNRLCSSGVLLANSALAAQVTIRHRMVWYGMLPELPVTTDWSRLPVGVLFGGTLHEERGCRLFIDAVRLLMKQLGVEQRGRLTFHVTGHGPMQAELEAFARETNGWVIFLGLLERAAYLDILGRSHVGLMLNLSTHEMSGTTFPSKVLEYTAAGLLVMSTPVSDVPSFFGADGVILLSAETPQGLAQALSDVLADVDKAAGIAARGVIRARAQCAPLALANQLIAFFGNAVISVNETKAAPRT